MSRPYRTVLIASAAFAGWAAAQHQLSLPPKVDWPHYLQRAAQRLALVQRIELVRHLFRRPLELWLALDKALYLQQHGYRVIPVNPVAAGQEILGEMLGLTRKTVNAHLASFERDGLVCTGYGKVTLCNIKGLENIANS